ncbi:MAG: hypothetical protein ABEH90_06530, partial [Halolamina sp.]
PPTQPADWPVTFGSNVVALDEDDGDLFAVLIDDTDMTGTLVSLAPDGTVNWDSEFPADEFGNGPDEADEAGWEWSTWVTTERVFLAAGIRHKSWTVRAFRRTTGDELWSFRKERQLAVRDVTPESLLVTAEEMFVPETTHDTPEEPLTSHVYLLDRETGDATRLGSLDGVRGGAATPDGAYLVTVNGVTAFDNAGGSESQRWQRPLSGEGIGVYTHNDRIVTLAKTEDRSEIVGFGPDSERRWQRQAPETHGSDSLFVDGVLYVGGGDGVVAVRADGTVAWRDDRPGGWFIYDDATGRVYTRSGVAADAAAAYGPDGDWRWTFDPDSKNAWPTTVTDQAVLATAITGDHASEPFYTVYAVDPETGDGSELVGLDTIFSVESVGNRAYFAAGRRIHAYEPAPGN